jgi:DNA-binding transcriptional ArsR family regulator
MTTAELKPPTASGQVEDGVWRGATGGQAATHADRESGLELTQMREAASQACTLMKALANPDRLMILCQLSQGELRVGELEERLSIVQPTLSQQLTVLREQQLVSTRREGKHIFYTLSSPQALAVIQTLYQEFCRPACAREEEPSNFAAA